jgi:hypothetical protein
VTEITLAKRLKMELIAQKCMPKPNAPGTLSALSRALVSEIKARTATRAYWFGTAWSASATVPRFGSGTIIDTRRR